MSNQLPTEQSLLAILSSDADLRTKAHACQDLVHTGGAKSVPALAALLNDEKLSDYARSPLEMIKDPSAGAALRDALPKLQGRLFQGGPFHMGFLGNFCSLLIPYVGIKGGHQH